MMGWVPVGTYVNYFFGFVHHKMLVNVIEILIDLSKYI